MGLEGVELMMELERTYRIEIPNSDARTLQTIGDVHEYLVRRLAPRISRNELWNELRQILMEKHGLKPEWIKAETDLYRDLAFGG